jgi:hypothetical protein
MRRFAGFFIFSIFLFLSPCGMIPVAAHLPLDLQREETVPFRKKQMLRDLDFITNIFEISYAPSEWKSEHLGWNLDAERVKAKGLVVGDSFLKSKGFQRIVKNFCQSTKDYHVVPEFYSTEWSSLPFGINSFNGKYFIAYIEEVESVSLEEGDQLLLIDGVAINEAVDNFRLKEIGSNYIETDRALAEYYFTSRFGSSGHDVPKGTVELTYCKANSTEILVCSLDWDYHSERILGGDFPSAAKAVTQKKRPLQKDPWHKLFMTSHYKASPNDTSSLLGSKKSVLPSLGTILWESEAESEFHAYLFLTDEYRVCGYVRIPTYYVEGDKAALEFAEIIEFFEEVSDVLVVDQLNNGGGTVLYLYALLAMLTPNELELPKHRVMLTQEDLYYAINRSYTLESIKNDRSARKKFGETLEGIFVNHNLIKCLLNSCQFIIDQWNAGKLYTDYSYLYGIEKIVPHPEVNYTKPILVLINSLNFSAADFFPAIMQDNKRATIMGTRTAGAGGYIENISFPNLNGIEGIDITASFAMRSNGVPIENFGVTPDIIYEVSQRDLQNNYSEYKENILKELKSLIPE